MAGVRRMKYFLRIRAIGQFPEVPIDSARFASLKIFRSVLVAALAREEIYEVLITNYRSLEELLVTESVSTMVQRRFDYSDLNDGRLALNVAYVNILTAARLYVDQIASKTQACDPSQLALAGSIKKLLSTEYDGSKSYRFMEALRNHVQHAGLPVSSVSYGSRRNKEDAYQQMEYHMEVKASKESLLENAAFKKSAVEGLPEKIDLIAATREYVEALSRIQAFARLSTAASVSNARQEISATVEQYAAVYGKKPVGLAAIQEDNGSWVEAVPLILDWDDVRQKLERRNEPLKNLAKRYVSSRIRA
jgi:hypothetical protein